MKHLKIYQTEAEYESAEKEDIQVSYVENSGVKYDKKILTLENIEVGTDVLGKYIYFDTSKKPSIADVERGTVFQAGLVNIYVGKYGPGKSIMITNMGGDVYREDGTPNQQGWLVDKVGPITSPHPSITEVTVSVKNTEGFLNPDSEWTFADARIE